MRHAAAGEVSLADRVAVVTGASSGIGAATAITLAARGARVALFAQRIDHLAEVVATITRAGGRARAQAVDIADAHAVQHAAEEVAETIGAVNLLVNNLGLILPKPVDDLQLPTCEQMIDANLRSTLNMLAAFTPQLVDSGVKGVADVVNVSSIAAHTVASSPNVHSASKAALAALSDGLRAELGGRGVRVTAIEPGLTDSELVHREARGGLDEMITVIDLLSAQDVADLIGYVVSRPEHVNLARVVVMPTQQVSRTSGLQV